MSAAFWRLALEPFLLMLLMMIPIAIAEVSAFDWLTQKQDRQKPEEQTEPSELNARRRANRLQQDQNRRSRKQNRIH
jgi:hypothetical protein